MSVGSSGCRVTRAKNRCQGDHTRVGIDRRYGCCCTADGNRYVVGIDLGTTNSAAMYVDTSKKSRRVRVLPIPQLVAPGQSESLETLPSFHYQPATGELPSGASRVPRSAPRRRRSTRVSFVERTSSRSSRHSVTRPPRRAKRPAHCGLNGLSSPPAHGISFRWTASML